MANFNTNCGGGGGRGNDNHNRNNSNEMSMNIGDNHHHQHHSRGFPSSTTTSKPSAAASLQQHHGSNLTRHSSSPAGFLGHLASGTPGFSITEGRENYGNRHEAGGGPTPAYTGGNHHHNVAGPSSSSRRLNSSSQQNMSFTLNKPLDKISELAAAAAAAVDNDRLINIDINCADLGSGSHDGSSSSSMISRSGSGSGGGFSIGPWEDGDAFVFSTHSGKRAKQLVDPALLSTLSAFESSDHQIDLSQAGLEMGSLRIPEDSVPCKIRAKRGCATHPRSIAERERRTRISGKLKKLQELVPNMDKQTSYSEMLDLAVDHIKGLQDQILKLNKEMEGCTCGGCGRHNRV